MIRVLEGRPGVSVLMFHGLCRSFPAYSGFPGSKTCLLPVDAFSTIVSYCARNFDILRLEDLDDYLEAGSQRPAVIFSFDDALASVIDLGVPVLEAYDASAAVFVTTSWTDSARTPDIFLLEPALWDRVPVQLKVRFGEREVAFQVDSKQQIAEVLNQLWGAMFEDRYPPFLLSSDQVTINEEPWDRQSMAEDRHFWLPATWDELRSAAGQGTIEIGSHMVDHRPLSWLPDEDILSQLQESRDQLSDRIGLPVSFSAFPHGQADERTVRMAESVYRWSFTIEPGQLHIDSARGAAPRYHVPSEAPWKIKQMLRWRRLQTKFLGIG
jgi:peptidoglycan/xylan/chitin deacetylase (PgdA/CDA1 family)